MRYQGDVFQFVKFKKFRKTRLRNIKYCSKTTKITNGFIGLRALESGRVDFGQLEAMRRDIVNVTNRVGRIFFKIYPNLSITRKAKLTRMGKGKGNVVGYIALVRGGMVIVELTGCSKEVALEALLKAKRKLNIRTKIIYKNYIKS